MTRALIILSLVICARTFGQSAAAIDTSGIITISTDPPGADLYVDSVFVGKTPLKDFRIAEGTHLVRAFYPSVFAWNAIVVPESVMVLRGAHLEKQIDLGEVISIQSDPPDGIVVYRGRILGETPLFTRLSSPLAGDLRIEREGFDSLQVPVSEIQKGLVRVKLRAKNGMAGSVPGDGLALAENGATDHWLTYASGATMIVSGVASAYLKDRANRHFDAYSLTGSPADLSRTRTLDRQAAATLILSEISFAVLTYLLLSD